MGYSRKHVLNNKHFRDMLVAKRQEILGNVSELEYEFKRPETDEGPALRTHPAEVGTDNFELENTARLMESERELLKDIDRALECMELGDYGFCEACRKRIPVKRLRAIPWARFCITCADAADSSRPALVRPPFRMRPFPIWQEDR
ncbi:MAG TPA: hypothetical protein ENI81_00070 [Phycisphaerales bacterium]|nr:hypothetical protein [Phycisphaerales bacterium]